MGTGDVEMPQNLEWHTEILPYFMDKGSLDCCKTLVNFQSSEKVGSDNFCQFSYSFHGGEAFQRSLLHCFWYSCLLLCL